MNDLVFLDTETLGLHPDAPIWEFAAVRRSDETGAEYTAEFTIEHGNPERWLADLPDQFVADYFHRYDPADAWCEAAAAAHIAVFTADATVIGCNPGFDIERLEKLLHRNNVPPCWHYHPIDTASVAIGFLAGRDEPIPDPWKSDALSAALGVDPTKYARHTALGDVWWMMAQFDRMGIGR